MKYYQLTEMEAKTIVKVIRKTKMDCWFYLEKNQEGYYIKDLEERKRKSLRVALKEAKDGFIELESLGISKEEIDILNSTLKKMNIV